MLTRATSVQTGMGNCVQENILHVYRVPINLNPFSHFPETLHTRNSFQYLNSHRNYATCYRIWEQKNCRWYLQNVMPSWERETQRGIQGLLWISVFHWAQSGYCNFCLYGKGLSQEFSVCRPRKSEFCAAPLLPCQGSVEILVGIWRGRIKRI